MNTLKALAATLALTASSMSPCFAAVVSGGHGDVAYPGGVGRVDRGPGPGGRSSFRSDSRSRFVGAAGGWGFAHADAGAGWRPQHWRRHDWRGRGWGEGYAYGGYPYDAAGYGEAYGPGPFGPQPSYGDSVVEGYGPVGRPMAPALAPAAYGTGVHDGAYAYGYNGYAQTPPLPQLGPSGVWEAFPGARACGC